MVSGMEFGVGSLAEFWAEWWLGILFEGSLVSSDPSLLE